MYLSRNCRLSKYMKTLLFLLSTITANCAVISFVEDLGYGKYHYTYEFPRNEIPESVNLTAFLVYDMRGNLNFVPQKSAGLITWDEIEDPRTPYTLKLEAFSTLPPGNGILTVNETYSQQVVAPVPEPSVIFFLLFCISLVVLRHESSI